MSMKRSRAAYEKDLRAQQSPYVSYGTPLPPLDPDVRDDGSYVPVWKQEVTDERGRKRLHGAFTGGFSAGYFNTVGSKEGWAPSTFVSSRSNRKKDDAKPAERRPEDYMDEEDLANIAEHERVTTAQGFAGLGSTESEFSQRGAFVDLFKTEGETMGVKLLRKMGWREGQGIGPKIRRAARLDDGTASSAPGSEHLFAPENTKMVSFVRKTDHKGLGFAGEQKLGAASLKDELPKGEDDDDTVFGTSNPTIAKKKKKPIRGGIGIGVLNDTGSDDEDPYEIGPRISYNRTIGGDKKKKKNVVANAAVRPVFISKKAAAAKASLGFRKCHDGRLPLDGFVLASTSDAMAAAENLEKYKPLAVPEGWKSSKTPKDGSTASSYLSTADAARSSNMDAKSRAALLGEKPLPGKSVFDFLSSTARDRIAAATGKSNLPAGLGEIPEGYALTPEEKQRELQSQIPKVEPETAAAALARGSTGWMPYADNEAKKSRYRDYLEIQAGIRAGIPAKPVTMSKDDWLKELQEFAHCAQIFKPMTGMMATRFTTSRSAPSTNLEVNNSAPLLSKPEPKQEDPAEAAAKVGMFGRMTRSEADFYPTRLLCKRFGVRAPAHVQSDEKEGGVAKPGAEMPVSKADIDELLSEASRRQHQASGSAGRQDDRIVPTATHAVPVVDVERNEALEKEKPSRAVFKAIFGDDSDEE